MGVKRALNPAPEAAGPGRDNGEEQASPAVLVALVMIQGQESPRFHDLANFIQPTDMSMRWNSERGRQTRGLAAGLPCIDYPELKSPRFVVRTTATMGRHVPSYITLASCESEGAAPAGIGPLS